MCISRKISKKFFNKKLITLRIANIFGKFRFKKGTIEKIISNLLIKLKYDLNNSSLKRTYINVETLVRIISLLIDKSFNRNLLFNIGNPKYVFNFEELCIIIGNIFNKKISYYSQKTKIRNNYNSICLPNTFMKRFNFKFTNNLKKELFELAKFIKENEK